MGVCGEYGECKMSAVVSEEQEMYKEGKLDIGSRFQVSSTDRRTLSPKELESRGGQKS